MLQRVSAQRRSTPRSERGVPAPVAGGKQPGQVRGNDRPDDEPGIRDSAGDGGTTLQAQGVRLQFHTSCHWSATHTARVLVLTRADHGEIHAVRYASAQRKLLDVMNTLGLSTSLMRVIERRQKLDQWLVYFGMLLTLAVIYALYSWKFATVGSGADAGVEGMLDEAAVEAAVVGAEGMETEAIDGGASTLGMDARH